MKRLIFLLAVTAILCSCGVSRSSRNGSDQVNTSVTIETNGVYQSVYEMIDGRFPGVVVEGHSISIRGAAGEPLFVVNGVKTMDIEWLNPSDVKNIEVLKDASATALYGMDGINGVIVITLK